MEILHAENGSPDWLYRAYDYVRTDAFCFGQGIPMEFDFMPSDPPLTEVKASVLFEDDKPVAGCRISFPSDGIGRIERVCTIREKQKIGYGRILIADAEKWIQQYGVNRIIIVSQDRAVGFYHKLGYVTNDQLDPVALGLHRPRKSDDTAPKRPRLNLGFRTILVEKYL